MLTALQTLSAGTYMPPVAPAGTLTTSPGAPYRLMPAHFYHCLSHDDDDDGDGMDRLAVGVIELAIACPYMIRRCRTTVRFTVNCNVCGRSGGHV